MTHRSRALLITALLLAGLAHAAPVAVATYDFSTGTLAAAEPGAAALVAIDPAGTNAFMTDTVFGVTKTVYRFDGTPDKPAGNQGGLSLNTTGLLTSKAYSIDMVFSFDYDGPTWERILDASNRTSDNGFYVEPGHKLQVYPTGGGPTSFTFGEYHRVSLTNNGLGHVTAYLDGVFQFDLLTAVMDFDSYVNPDKILSFFADDLTSATPQEWVPGKVSLIRLYDFELKPGDIVPEPVSLALVGIGLLAAAGARLRRR